MRRIVLALACLAFIALPVSAQIDANNARGFESGKLYNFFGLDSVSTFNGNMNLRIPIGQPYGLRPGFSYQFMLTYNSKVWDYEVEETNPAGSVRNALPENYSNAGLGWILGLGRVLVHDRFRPWTYVAPDGTQHDFGSNNTQTNGVLYTRDSSYMRMTLTPRTATSGSQVTSITVETPDGIKSTFNAAGELVEMIDGFGNWVRVQPNGMIWTITDGFGADVLRTHRITFSAAPALYDSTNPNFAKRITKLELAAFPGTDEVRTDTFAVYTFEYDDTSIANGGCGTTAVNGWEPKAAYNVPLLKKVTLPDGSTYEPHYNQDNSAAVCSSGTLNKLVLPTKGAIRWKHGGYALSRPACRMDPVDVDDHWSDQYTGVIERWMEDQAGNRSMVATYVPKLEPGEPGEPFKCGKENQFTYWTAPTLFHNTVTSGGASVKHHFSAYRASDYPLVPTIAVLQEYGLPLTRSNSSAGLYLSTETRASGATDVLRSTWVAYDMDATSGTEAVNSRVRTSRTIFNDDTGDAGPETDPNFNRCKTSAGVVEPCWIETTREQYAQFGNYRIERTTSNFPGSSSRTRQRQYNPQNLRAQTWPAGRLWFLGEYTTSQMTETPVLTTTTFNTSTGTVTSVLTGSGAGSMLAATCRDSRGWVTSERWLGGATRTPPADPCTSTARDTGEYALDHFYTHAADTITHSARWQGTTPDIPVNVSLTMTDLVLDETLDRNTGLPKTTRDGAGLETTYSFDRMSRLSSLTPPGLAATTYGYEIAEVTATAFVPARVTATTESATPAIGLMQQQYQYDALGRLWREKTLMPDATYSVKETLYDQHGFKASVSEMEKLVIPSGQTEYAFVPANKTTFTDYDPFGRVGKITAPDDTETTFAYTGTRKTARTVTLAGDAKATTIEETDAHGQLAAVTEGSFAPVRTAYGYDANGNLVSVNMAGQTRSFNYNSRGLLTSETHPESGTTQYSSFDARGQAGTRTTPTATLTIVRDDAGRTTDIKSGSNAVKQFRFDAANGRLIATGRNNYLAIGTVPVTEGISYDDATGRPERRDQAVGGLVTGRSFAHAQAFNDLGQLESIVYPFETTPKPGDPPDYVPPHRFDLTVVNRNGYLVQVPNWASMTYQPNGTIAAVNHTGSVTETWTPNPDGMARPRAITVRKGSSTTLWSSGNYTFDGAGNIASIGTTSYRYDPFGRLISWTEEPISGTTTTRTIGYDAFGNQLAFGLAGCSTSPGGNKTCYTTSLGARPIDGLSNRYADATYDGSGNLIADATRSFTYDAVNMPVSVTAGGRTFHYVYNVDDERILVLEPTSATTFNTTWFLRGFNHQLLSIWRGETWTEDYIWRGGALLGLRSASGNNQHYSLDHLGSPRVITSNTGTLIGTQSFAPFGAGGTTGSGALQFTGHERDSANVGGGSVDLPDYVHARLLDVRWGRFLSVDPTWKSADLGKPQSWNRYAYVLNNPLNNTDPDGKCTAPCIMMVYDSRDTRNQPKPKAAPPGTLSVGAGAAYSGGGSTGSVSVSVNVDRVGALSGSVTTGLGVSTGKGGSVAGQIQVTNGRGLDDLGGKFEQSGASGAFKGKAGVDVVEGTGADGKKVEGVVASAGVGLGAEVHKTVTWTWQLKLKTIADKVTDVLAGVERALVGAAMAK